MFWLKNAIEGSPVVFVVVLEVHKGINECLASNAERLVLDPLIGTFDDDERQVGGKPRKGCGQGVDVLDDADGVKWPFL